MFSKFDLPDKNEEGHWLSAPRFSCSPVFRVLQASAVCSLFRVRRPEKPESFLAFFILRFLWRPLHTVSNAICHLPYAYLGWERQKCEAVVAVQLPTLMRKLRAASVTGKDRE